MRGAVGKVRKPSSNPTSFAQLLHNNGFREVGTRTSKQEVDDTTAEKSLNLPSKQVSGYLVASS